MAGTTSTGPYQWKSVTIRGGGFVDGIIFSHVDEDLVYARTDMGGAYRWDTAMNGWVALTDWVSQSHSNWTGIESIVADPVMPIRVHGGRYLHGNTDAVILRSTDRGANFTPNPISYLSAGNAYPSNGRQRGRSLDG